MFGSRHHALEKGNRVKRILPHLDRLLRLRLWLRLLAIEGHLLRWLRIYDGHASRESRLGGRQAVDALARALARQMPLPLLAFVVEMRERLRPSGAHRPVADRVGEYSRTRRLHTGAWRR